VIEYLFNDQANAREIATCKQNVGQKEDFMHSNVQMDIILPWIDSAFTLTRALKEVDPLGLHRQ
jgi:hypothetical protein